jgi:hypothetical protein
MTNRPDFLQQNLLGLHAPWAMCENDIGRRLGNKKDVDAMLAYGAILRLGTIGPSIG